MRVLFLDCFSGISGDMTVGALVDLGVKPSALEWELSKLEIGDFHMHFERETRQHISGIKFGIHAGGTHTEDQDEDGALGHDEEHEHDHDHESESEGEHPHDHDHGAEVAHAHLHECAHAHEHAAGRNHREIRELIEKSELSEFVKKHALGIFGRIAEAEGKIHGVPAEEVSFHEVGALDSIADIVCACAGIEALGVEKVFVSRLFDGHGTIQCAHGIFPLPAPATLEILRGIPLGQIDEPHELITPTGAAIVAEFGAKFGSMPEIKSEKIGYGLGTRELASRPNVLRAVLGELVAS